MTEDDRLVPWHARPPEVRARIGLVLPPGHAVWACPCNDGRGGVTTEWWWIDGRCELVQAFWLD